MIERATIHTVEDRPAAVLNGMCFVKNTHFDCWESCVAGKVKMNPRRYPYMNFADWRTRADNNFRAQYSFGILKIAIRDNAYMAYFNLAFRMSTKTPPIGSTPCRQVMCEHYSRLYPYSQGLITTTTVSYRNA